MNDRMDPEEIGALLDGAAGGERREALLARLATADDDYDLFADTAAVLREIEEGDAMPAAVPAVEEPAVDDPKVIPLRPRRASVWRSPAVRGLAAAAVLATVAVPLYRSRTSGADWGDPGRMAALGNRGTRVSAESLGVHLGRVTRGGNTAASDSGEAARLGALMVDAHVAAAAGDTAAVAALALDGKAVADEIADAAFLPAEFSRLAASATAPGVSLVDSVSAAAHDAEGLFSYDPGTRVYFALGVWTEAARLAARREDAAFFRRPESRRALAAAASLTGLSADAVAAAKRLSTLAHRTGVQNWTSVRGDLDTLLRELAR